MFSVAFWVASVALLVAGTVLALVVAGGRSAHRHPGLERRLRDCESAYVECLDGLDKLTAITKRKYQRDYAREQRSTKKNGGELTDAEWKKQMESQLALKRAGVITDGN